MATRGAGETEITLTQNAFEQILTRASVHAGFFAHVPERCWSTYLQNAWRIAVGKKPDVYSGAHSVQGAGADSVPVINNVERF